MTEEEADHMYDVKNLLLKKVKALVNDFFQKNKESERFEEEVRQALTEEVRFWKDWS